MIEKPPHGSPCNGCGGCCEASLCSLGQQVFRRFDGPCPALESHPDGSGKRICGLVANPRTYAPVKVAMNGAEAMSAAASMLVGTGIGCDAQLVDEPYNRQFGAQLKRYRQKHADDIWRACRAWFI